MQTQCSIGVAMRTTGGMARFEKCSRLLMSAAAVLVVLLNVSGCMELEARDNNAVVAHLESLRYVLNLLP